MAISEYDAFGPWIYDVTEKHPLPPQFEDHVEKQDYEILIKIPRDIERRKANPDMPLYNYVIGCFKETLYIYERNALEIRKYLIKSDKICAIKDLRDMLLGRYQLFTHNKVISFEYNTVSADMVTKLTNWIRSKFSTPIINKPLPVIEDHDVSKIDPIYSNLFHTMQRNDDSLKIIAMQPKIKLSHASSNVFKRIYNSVLNSHLESSLYLQSKNDVIFLQRGHAFTRLGFSDYSNTFTFIPLTSITNVVLGSSEISDEVNQVQIQTSGHLFDAMFSNDNNCAKDMTEYLKKINS